MGDGQERHGAREKENMREREHMLLLGVNDGSHEEMVKSATREAQVGASTDGPARHECAYLSTAGHPTQRHQTLGQWRAGEGPAAPDCG